MEHRVFPNGGSPPTIRKFAHPPPQLRKLTPTPPPPPTLPPPNFYSPPTKQQLSSYNPIKIAVLAVVIVPAPFLF